MTKIGVTLPQFTDDRDVFISGAERARSLGFDSLWVFDHLWPLGGRRERPILECWTALSYLAGAVPEVEIGTLVTRSSLRNPVVLAKMAATVGAIAPGRLIVALGSGDALNEQENRAFGLPFYEGDERVRQLIATLEVVQRYLTADRAGLGDGHPEQPVPASPIPALPARVWAGGRSVELMEVAGRIADGWNGWGANLDTFATDSRRVGALAGTRPFDISWAGQVLLGATDEEARERLGDRDPARFVVGGPATIRAALVRAVEAGAGHLIVALPDAGKKGAYETLAEAVESLR